MGAEPKITKEEALEQCQTASAPELETPGHREGLMDTARRAGASMDEIAAAFAGTPDDP
jgi:hypothetical protein